MAAGRSVRTYQQLFKCDTAIHLWAACSKNQSCNRSEISRVSSFKRFWGDALASQITRLPVLTNTSLIAFINLVTGWFWARRTHLRIYFIHSFVNCDTFSRSKAERPSARIGDISTIWCLRQTMHFLKAHDSHYSLPSRASWGDLFWNFSLGIFIGPR